jgi:glycosyltransferase involved in cell wall biosynthesis
MTFSVIIPTYNRLASLQRTLESVLNQDFDPADYEVIVIDDGSTDGTARYLASIAQGGKAKCIRLDHSGPATARNKGIQIAEGVCIAFTDDDCRVPRDWLTNLQSLLEDDDVAIVGGSVINRVEGSIFSDISEFMTAFLENAHNKIPGRAHFLTSNNIACRRGEVIAAGMFDERFKRAGAEERELCERLLDLGKKVVFKPSIQIEHYHHLTLRSLLKQQSNYGRGSYLLYRILAERGRHRDYLSVFRIYLGMIKASLSGRSIWRGTATLLGVILSQLSVLWGYRKAVAEQSSFSNRRVRPS